MKKDAKYGTAPNHCNGTRCNIHSSFSNNRSAHTSNFFWKFHSESSPQHDMDTSHGHRRHKTISVKITDQKISVERPRRSDECKRRRDRLCSVRGLLAVAWLQPLTLRGGGEVEQEKKKERGKTCHSGSDWRLESRLERRANSRQQHKSASPCASPSLVFHIYTWTSSQVNIHSSTFSSSLPGTRIRCPKFVDIFIHFLK